ncbi:hypothetical protein SBVc24_0072 [Vibrio phage 24]|nr:hypothetical protein SBVc24_0072 [Vibrio phage 24]
MTPINYYNCPDCKYPTYGPRRHILAVFTKFKTCPGCGRKFDDTDPSRIKSKDPGYTRKEMGLE